MSSAFESVEQRMLSLGGRQVDLAVSGHQVAGIGPTGLNIYILEGLETHDAMLLARELRVQLSGSPGMIVEIPKVRRERSFSEIMERFRQQLDDDDDDRLLCDIVFVPCDSIEVQYAIIEAFGYSDKSSKMEQRLEDCKQMLVELSKIVKFKLGMVGLGHIGLFFVDKLDAKARKKIVLMIDQFVGHYQIRDLPPKSLDAHIRATGSVII